MSRESRASTVKNSLSTNLVFASHFLLFLALFLLLYFFVPSFAPTFKQLETRPPPSTRWTLDLAQWVVKLAYLFPLLAAGYYAALLGIQRLDRRLPGVTLCWTLFVWYAGAAFLLYLAYSLMMGFPAAEAPVV